VPELNVGCALRKPGISVLAIILHAVGSIHMTSGILATHCESTVVYFQIQRVMHSDETFLIPVRISVSELRCSVSSCRYVSIHISIILYLCKLCFPNLLFPVLSFRCCTLPYSQGNQSYTRQRISTSACYF
jgi:hypothetical protein